MSFRSVLFKNLIIAVLVSLLLLFVIGKIMKVYTRHNQTITVPDLIGMMPQQLENSGLTNEFEVLVIDSVFDQEKPGGSIVFQEPPANSIVKPGRTIYLTLVASAPEKVRMPELNDLTLRQATSVLETYGLKLGRADYVPNLAKNAVVEQFFNGMKIAPGDWIIKGSHIDLQVGNGSGGFGDAGITGNMDSLGNETDSL